MSIEITKLHALLPLKYQVQIQRIDIVQKGRHLSAVLSLTDGRLLFAKQLSESTEEARLLGCLNVNKSLVGAVPKVIHYDDNICIFEFIAGDHFDKDCITQNILQFVSQLHRVHQTVVSGVDIPKLNVADNLLLSSGNIEKVQTKYERAKQQIKSSSEYVGLLHGDLSKLNIFKVRQDSNINFVFIDWEFAQVGDCRWDLATIAVEFKLTAAEFRRLSNTYQKVANIVDSQFYQVARAWSLIYAVVCLIWAQKNQQPWQEYMLYIQGFVN